MFFISDLREILELSHLIFLSQLYLSLNESLCALGYLWIGVPTLVRNKGQQRSGVVPKGQAGNFPLEKGLGRSDAVIDLTRTACVTWNKAPSFNFEA